MITGMDINGDADKLVFDKFDGGGRNLSCRAQRSAPGTLELHRQHRNVCGGTGKHDCWAEDGIPPSGAIRLIARDFCEKGGTREDFFAAAPRFDTLKSLLLLSLREGLKVMVVDVKKANLNGVVKTGNGNHDVQSSDEGRPKGYAGS